MPVWRPFWAYVVARTKRHARKDTGRELNGPNIVLSCLGIGAIQNKLRLIGRDPHVLVWSGFANRSQPCAIAFVPSELDVRRYFIEVDQHAVLRGREKRGCWRTWPTCNTLSGYRNRFASKSKLSNIEGLHEQPS